MQSTISVAFPGVGPFPGLSTLRAIGAAPRVRVRRPTPRLSSPCASPYCPWLQQPRASSRANRRGSARDSCVKREMICFEVNWGRPRCTSFRDPLQTLGGRSANREGVRVTLSVEMVVVHVLSGVEVKWGRILSGTFKCYKPGLSCQLIVVPTRPFLVRGKCPQGVPAPRVSQWAGHGARAPPCHPDSVCMPHLSQDRIQRNLGGSL